MSVPVLYNEIPDRDLNAHNESFKVVTGIRFTLMPPENATDNFVKVVQRVPVKIVIDEPLANLERLWAGESVEPKVNLHHVVAESGHRSEPLPPAILGATGGPGAFLEQVV